MKEVEMKRTFIAILILGVAFIGLGVTSTIHAASKGEIDRSVEVALEDLYGSAPGARELGKNAKGILVFPKVVKAGFILGGQYGEGGRSLRTERRQAITEQWQLHMVFKLERSRSAMLCFS